MKKKFREQWLPATLLVVLVGFAIWLAVPKPGGFAAREAVSVHGIYFTEPNYLNPFQLKSTLGKTFSDQDLVGHWTILFFGFTHCPDICPTTMVMLNTTLADFKKASPKAKPPQVVFVSVDPARDRLDVMKKYVTYFNPTFMGATGSEESLKGLTRQVGVVFDKIVLDDAHPENYVMEHSTSIILINPKGAIQAIFTAPHDPAMLSKEMIAVYQAYQKES